MKETVCRNTLHACVVNFRIFWGDAEKNLAHIKETVIAAAKSGVEMIVFPELALHGTAVDSSTDDISKNMQSRLAQTVPGPATDEIASLTKQYGIYVIWGMLERDPGDASIIYNSAVVCGPQGLIGSYRKIHPYDTEYCWGVTRGDTPFLFDTPWGKAGIGICYDTYHYPELLRYYVAKGCRLYLNPTAACNQPIPNDDNGYPIFLKSIVAREGIFVLSSNIAGQEILSADYGGNAPAANLLPAPYGGGSVIIGPSNGLGGNIYRSHLYAGSWDHSESGVFHAIVDLSLATRGCYQVNPLSGQPDFRPDLYCNWYKELAELYGGK